MKKDFLFLKKSRWLLFMLFALLTGVSPAWADELTVNDGTTTNAYIPINGSWVDTEDVTSEFIIPAETLEEITGATLSQMSFYVSTAATWEPEFKVYIKEVAQTVYASYGGSVIGDTDATTVYEGVLSPKTAGGTMDVNFTKSYVYGGGNLLIGLKVTKTASYASCGFYGISTSTTYKSYNSKQGAQGFLPKVTFTYTPDASYVAKPTDVNASSITVNSATISWDAVDGADSYELSCSTSSTEPDTDGSYTSVNSTSYNQAGLTSGTTYYVYVRTVKGGNKSKWSAVCSFVPGTLTINNVSTTTNAYVPIYGYDMDSYNVKCQFVIPSSSISALNGNQITKLVFYGTDSRSALGSNTFDVYMQEVADATISSLAEWSTLDKVYSGSLSVSDNMMTIALPEGFDYSGGNLLIGFLKTSGSSWTNFTWTGVSATSASLSGASSATQQNFLPQTTFYYAAQTAAIKKPKSLAVSEVATTTAKLGWTNGGDETAWQIAYSTDAVFDPDAEGTTKVAANANPFTLTELTANTTYYAYVRAEKGGEYSAWSNKAEFTTLSATPVITLSTTSHNFGLVSDASAQALTLTISNTGGAALTGLSVTPSAGFAVTDADGNALTATTIAASSSLVVKVKVSALGQQDGTITISGDGIEDQVVTVSGYMLDDTKILETFASASSVSRWTVASGWTFNASTGAYSGTSSRVMTSPKLSVAAGDVLALNVKLGWNGGSLIVEGLDADGNTVYEPVTYNSSNGGLTTSTYTLLTISDMPTTVAKVKLTGYYAYINVFNGFSYVNDPVLGLYSNEACTSAQASPATKNFGFATEAQSQLYYIKNTGNGQIDLTIDAPTGFTASVADNALTEGESTALTVTMTASDGLHDGTITVTAKNHDNDAVLGTFVVKVNGGITGTKNNVSLASTFPAGWQTGTWSISGGAARVWSATESDLITTTLRVTEGEKLLLDAKKYDTSSDSKLSYSYSTNNGTSWSDAVSLTSNLDTDYKIIAISGIPAGDVLMKFTGAYGFIRQIYGFEAVAEPILTFAASDYSFGMINTAKTTGVYTIKNDGTEKLDNLEVTSNNSNFSIAVTDDANEIAANGTATFTVTLNTTNTGKQEGVVTISGDGVTSKTFKVSGYVADDTKIFTDFASTPERWENSGWSFNANGAVAGYSSEAVFTTPKIVNDGSQTLAISAKLQSASTTYYVKVEGFNTTDNDWTYTKTLTTDVLNNTDYTVVEITDIPAAVNRLRVVGKYVYVNGFNGFTYDDNDPEFAMFSNSECTAKITEATATNAWGFVTEDKTATYYIKNVGTGTMTLTKSDAPTGFTATLGKNSLGTGESTSLSIAMENDAENNEGYHAGDVVLTAKDNANNELGTFTVTSSGVVVGSKTDINFTTLSDFPAGWEATNWSVSSGKATISYTSGDLKTGTYTVAAGESLVVEARRNSSSTYVTFALTYSYSTDGGSTWSAAKTITPSTTSYELIAISDIPAGNAIVKFTGTYVDIQRIYGYTAVQEPVMTLSPAATSYDFGMQTAAADYEITVTNSGTAAMENMTAALSGTDAADFEVALSVPEGSTATITDGKANVPVGQTVKVTATLKASTEFKTHNATLTISADGLADKEITLTGKTRDASKLFVDFDNVTTPATWDNEGWTVYNYGSDYYLYNSSNTTAYALTTQALTVAEGESISFDVKAYSSYGSPYLTVRYSYNGGISWKDFATYTYDGGTLTTSFATKTISDLNAGTVVLQFVGTYCGIDNIIGFAPKADEPTISVKKSSTTVNNGDTEAFGSIKAEATATYTIKNIGQGTLTITSPVTTTGDATATVSPTSLANGESATLTITMPVSAENGYGDKSGAVTVATSLGDFVINYTANVLNPDALDEQFASGQPSGWYFGGYWKVSDQQAMQEDSGTSADLITEQLSVSGTTDALTFQAARTSSSSAPTFNVYTSQNRVEWTPVDLGDLTLTTSYQDVTISGLAAGDYFVKISGARVKVDNFLGWTKKNNTRDLYVTATSGIPTATQNGGTTISPSATVTSLIAEEKGIYAKLFIDDTAGVATTAADIALNGSKTFSMSGTLPTTPGTYKVQIKVYYSDDTEAFATAENDVKVYYVFSDEGEIVTDGTSDVKLTRTFAEGWNTICLPFAVTDLTKFGEGTKAYEFSEYTDGSIKFTPVDALTAGTPYLLNVPAAISSGAIEFSDVTVSSATPTDVTYNGTFHGTYAAIAAESMDKSKYSVTTLGNLKAGDSAHALKGFRAYFTGITNDARLSIADGDSQGIDGIIADGVLSTDAYNLNGQRVETLKKGQLYIINGKKVVRK